MVTLYMLKKQVADMGVTLVLGDEEMQSSFFYVICY